MLEQSKWIACGKPAAVAVFSRAFRAEKPVAAATLTVTAAGVYEARLNGARVGKFFLAPGWTSYAVRHQVQQYDITALLARDNELAVTVGSGWFCGDISRARRPKDVGIMLIAALHLDYTDGTSEDIYTDRNWQSAESPIRDADIYQGETVDAAFCDRAPVPAVEVDYPKTQLIAQQGEEVHMQERLKPVRVIHTPAGETVLDFGQEITGVVEFTVAAHRGDEITLRCAEVLDRDGNFYTENYRAARSTMKLRCTDGTQTFCPALTFYGFRYICVAGWPGALDPNAFTAIAVSSAMRRTGWLCCGVPKLNRLFENIVWGQKDNFVDVPTDCPQRDERLGWTGDAQVFANTASYQFDTKKFFTKWLADVAADQRASGAVPAVVPDVLNNPAAEEIKAGAAWADVATVGPWQVYRHFGDRALLESQFELMRHWVDYMTATTEVPGLWLYKKETHYGDWLGLDAEAGSYVGASDRYLIASAFYYYSTGLLCEAGHALGRDVAAYDALRAQIRTAFRAHYPTYRTQTECTLAVYFDLAADKQAVADQLAQMVHQNGDRLTTGFVGTPYLLYALSQNGHADVAYTLLLQEAFPSWLYAVNHGATTVWEHWDGRREDGTFWSADMNSFNHYAYGSVAGWVFEEAAGITPAEPGFARVRIAPRPDARLGALRAVVDTPFGRVSSAWSYEDQRVRYEITTPVEAELVINGRTQIVPAGTHLF